MNKNRWLVIPPRLLLLLGLLLNAAVLAEDSKKVNDPPVAASADYTRKGADTCLKCHDEDSEFPVLSIFETKHAQSADKRTPFAGLQCEGCHGPGAEHAKKIRPGQKRASIGNFGPKSVVSFERQNEICVGCHATGGRIGWKGSTHDQVDVTCTSCHRIHAPRDAVLVKNEQPEVCYKCHKRERAEFYRPSVHPVRFGVMACSECHNTHGAFTASLLARPSLNQTCYGCHPEKRGPFLWEHAPVPEDCALCHVAHGSIHPALLIKRTPWLCQQCHSQAGHPSVALTPAGLPSGTPSAFLLSGACTSCHSQVHGSNHPSGVKLMR